MNEFIIKITHNHLIDTQYVKIKDYYKALNIFCLPFSPDTHMSRRLSRKTDVTSFWKEKQFVFCVIEQLKL